MRILLAEAPVGVFITVRCGCRGRVVQHRPGGTPRSHAVELDPASLVSCEHPNDMCSVFGGPKAPTQYTYPQVFARNGYVSAVHCELDPLTAELLVREDDTEDELFS